jgi:hypothetical protein
MNNITKKKICWFGGVMYAGILTEQKVPLYNPLSRMHVHIWKQQYRGN